MFTLLAYVSARSIADMLSKSQEKIKQNKESLNSNKLRIGVVVGPEGGLSTKEVDKLISSGAKCITLGKRILRTETAPIVIISNIIYEFEM